MKTVLFAWELGANLGHAKPLATVAKSLGHLDAKLFVAALDLLSARIAFGDSDVALLQAPVWPAHRHFGSETGQASYLDILVSIGFADPVKLGAVVDGWISLFGLVMPDVVVADHSPGLLVAAWIAKIPVIQVGSCFTTPPVEHDRLPPIRADRSAIMPETKVLASAATVVADRGGSPPPLLIDFFRTRARIVFGCRELDPYAAFRREPLFSPPEPLPSFVEPPIHPRLFVYLGSDISRMDELIQVLTQLDLPLEAYLRPEIAPLGRFLKLAGHVVHDSPPPLGDVLLNASHVVCEGGASTCFSALAAGRPVLGLALHAEADLNLSMMVHLGVGKRMERWDSEATLRHQIANFVHNHALQRQARHWAMVLSSRGAPNGLVAVEKALAACLG